jgi:hypothetical protein
MISELLMAAKLAKYAAGFESSLDTFFNIDPMFPLANAALPPVTRASTCYCSKPATEIKKYREEAKCGAKLNSAVSSKEKLFLRPSNFLHAAQESEKWSVCISFPFTLTNAVMGALSRASSALITVTV